MAFPAAAWAGHARTPECPVEFCAGIAADGSRVVFPFTEELTPAAGGPQVYEWSKGRLRPLVSIPKGAQRPAPIGLQGASLDARHVFVETNYSLTSDDVDGGLWDLYDIVGGIPALVSTGPLDAQRAGNSMVSFAGASADGGRVFFDSFLPMVGDYPSSCSYIYERANGTTTPVVYGPEPQEPLPPHLCHGDSFGGVSGDGSHLFFSTERDLVAEDESDDDIYQRVGSALSILTTYPEPPVDNCVDRPKFADSSADGVVVLFTTSTQISAEDTDSGYDIYLRERDGTFRLVSRGTDGGTGCSFYGDRAIALSADGTIAIFETRSRLSPADTDSSNDLYRADAGGEMMLLSTGPTDPNVDEQSKVMPDWVTDVSADARSVAFETRQPLVAADKDRSMDVYVSVNGVTELASTGPLQGSSAASAELWGISEDGETVVFATKARLTRSDLDRDRDLYLRQIGPKRTVLASSEAISPQMRVSARGLLLGSGAAEVRVGCPKAETSGPCHGTMSLRRGRSGLGRSAFSIAAGRHGHVRVRLPRSLSPPRSMRVLARVRGIDRLGNSQLTVRRVRLTMRGPGGR